MKPSRLAEIGLLIAAIAVVMTTAGCQSYHPKPLDLSDRLSSMEQRVDRIKSGDPTVFKRAGTEKDKPYSAADGLTLVEAELVALYFNPDLRLARIQVEAPLAGARESGRLPDPRLGLEGSRFLEEVGGQPWIWGAGLNLTIPLSGRLKVERAKAWAEYTAAWRAAAAAEWELLNQLRADWIRWSALKADMQAIQNHLKEIAPFLRIAESLAQAGELRPSEARVFRINDAAMRTDLEGLKGQAEEMRLTILGAMGLLAEAPVELIPQLDLDLIPAPEGRRRALLLKNHPGLQLARARYEAAEQALKHEIYKQYPDLVIGFGYGSEIGRAKLPFMFGLPIPVWNMNRRGIAEARSNRKAVAGAVEAMYENLVNRLDRAETALRSARNRREITIKELVPHLQDQIKEFRQLAKLGELNVLLLEDALHRSLEAERELIAIARSRALAVNKINALTTPCLVLQPEPKEARP